MAGWNPQDVARAARSSPRCSPCPPDRKAVFVLFALALWMQSKGPSKTLLTCILGARNSAPYADGTSGSLNTKRESKQQQQQKRQQQQQQQRNTTTAASTTTTTTTTAAAATTATTTTTTTTAAITTTAAFAHNRAVVVEAGGVMRLCQHRGEHERARVTVRVTLVLERLMDRQSVLDRYFCMGGYSWTRKQF